MADYWEGAKIVVDSAYHALRNFVFVATGMAAAFLSFIGNIWKDVPDVAKPACINALTFFCFALVPGDWNEGQRYALIFTREQGAINNQTLRQLTGSEVLAASHELRKLRDAGLLLQKGKGSATYYLPGPAFPSDDPSELGTLALHHGT